MGRPSAIARCGGAGADGCCGMALFLPAVGLCTLPACRPTSQTSSPCTHHNNSDHTAGAPSHIPTQVSQQLEGALPRVPQHQCCQALKAKHLYVCRGLGAAIKCLDTVARAAGCMWARWPWCGRYAGNPMLRRLAISASGPCTPAARHQALTHSARGPQSRGHLLKRWCRWQGKAGPAPEGLQSCCVQEVKDWWERHLHEQTGGIHTHCTVDGRHAKRALH